LHRSSPQNAAQGHAVSRRQPIQIKKDIKAFAANDKMNDCVRARTQPE
jgi:hypothetical protein